MSGLHKSLGVAHVFLSFLLFSSHVSAQNSYLTSLIQKSAELKLSQERDWQILVHYVPSTFGGVHSQVDDPKFFLSPQGRMDPSKELVATLKAFFEAQDPDPEKQHPQCKFVARYHWLKSKLDFDPSQLAQVPCIVYAKWHDEFQAKSVSLIFASYYVNNPASMFGHTMLKFDREETATSNVLTDYTANFAASTGNDNGILFAFYGLAGFYKGTYSLYPYYFKIREYVNFESRDLWEYQLSFSPEEVERLIQHLWELGHSYFDYYFIDENCSYHMLSLIEYARPSLRLKDHLHLFVAPSDTLKSLMHVPGLVTHITFRPSALSQFTARRERLISAEENILRDVIKSHRPLSDPMFLGVDQNRRALIADAALDYWTFHLGPGKHSVHQRQLLTERSHLPETPELVVKPKSLSPDLGHDSSRVGGAGGMTNHDSFEELRFRWLYHDLLASDGGYPRNAEIEAGNIRMRFYNKARKLKVEEGTGIRVLSLFPIDSLIRKPSWNVSFGWESERNDICGLCNALYIRGGSGFAIEQSQWGRQVLYFFLNAYSESSPWSALTYRIGPQGRMGILIDAGINVRIHLWGSYDYSPLGRLQTDYLGKLEARVTLSRNLEARIEAGKFKKGEEALGALQWYY